MNYSTTVPAFLFSAIWLERPLVACPVRKTGRPPAGNKGGDEDVM